MKVGGLAVDPMTKTPIVLLRDEEGDRTLPIWIGLLEATSLATQLEGINVSRPMTHDLLSTVVDEAGAKVVRIEVTELRDNTFYAVIHLDVGGEIHVIDSRPSDAIALALRTDSPIYVASAVLEASAASGDGPEGRADVETQDISEVSREEWAEILEKLDPSDFKYKM